jgi:hypothetical protein
MADASKPVSTIQLHTLLGQALESLMAVALERAGLKFVRSESHHGQGSHEPDFQVRDDDGLCILQVTNTQQPETFIKKRWRYVEQIAQTKSIEGPMTPCVSVVFGNRASLQQAEHTMSDYLFDAVIWMQEAFGSAEVENKLSEMIQERGAAPDIAKLVERDSALSKWVDRAAHGISNNIVLSRKHITKRPLYSVWQREHQERTARATRVNAQLTDQPVPTFLRRTFFKLAPFSDSECETLIAACRRPARLGDEVVALANFMTIGLRPSLGAKHAVADDEIVATVGSGYDVSLHKRLSAALFNEPKYRNLLDDIRDPGRCREIVRGVHELLASRNSSGLAALMLSTFRDPSKAGVVSERVWPLDVALAALGMSASEANRRYVEKFGHLGVSNPVKNFIVRTDQALASFADKERLRVFTTNLAGVVIGSVSRQLAGVDELAAQLRARRRDSLFLQPYINPTVELFIQSVGALGWETEEVSLESALALAPVPNRMKRIESLIACTRGKQRRVVKVIAAYEEGVGHKATEMSGRRRLLGYHAQVGELVRRDLPETHFVYEGEWPLDLLKMLGLSGWERVYSIWNLTHGEW